MQRECSRYIPVSMIDRSMDKMAGQRAEAVNNQTSTVVLLSTNHFARPSTFGSMIGGNGYVGATDTEKEIQDDEHDDILQHCGRGREEKQRCISVDTH
eukprot:scaffold15599_cov129-Skeletonema_dohrnii-CCMP3373.AAC.8